MKKRARSYRDILASLPIPRLRTIVQTRALDLRTRAFVRTHRALIDWLSGWLTTSHTSSFALLNTTIPQARVLFRVLSNDGQIPRSVLEEEVGSSEVARLTQVLARLEDCGLVLQDAEAAEPMLVSEASVGPYHVVPSAMRYTVADCVRLSDPAALTHIHQRLGLPPLPEPIRAGEAIAAALCERALVERAMEQSSEAMSALIYLLVDLGGATHISNLAQYLEPRVRNQTLSPGCGMRWNGGPPRNHIEEALGQGLLFTVQGSGNFPLLVCPYEIYAILRSNPGEAYLLPTAPELLPCSTAGRLVERWDWIVRDVCYLLAFVTTQKPAATAAGVMHRNSFKQFSRGLANPTLQYAEFVFIIAFWAGLLMADDSGKQFAMGPQARNWLRADRDEQVKALFWSWFGQATWSELDDPLFASTREYETLPHAEHLRRVVLDLLTPIDAGDLAEFYTCESLEHVAAFNAWFCLRGRDVGDPAPRDQNSSATIALGSAGGCAPGNVVLERLCRFSLFYLGMVQFAVDSEGGAAAVSLTDVGLRVWCSHLGAPATIADPATITVQPNMEIYVPPHLDAATLFALLRITDSTGTGTLTISRDSLRRALDDGDTSDAILATLNSRSSTPIPQSVDYLIKEVARRHGHIKVGHAGIYIQTTDPLVLKELQLAKGLKIRFQDQLADNVALVTADSVEDVLKQLRTAGYFPTSAHRDKRKHMPAPVEDEGAPLYEDRRSKQTGSVDSQIDWQRIESSPEPHVIPGL